MYVQHYQQINLIKNLHLACTSSSHPHSCYNQLQAEHNSKTVHRIPVCFVAVFSCHGGGIFH